MNDHEFDVAIIGAGAAGLSAAFQAESIGARVTLIEQNKIGGGNLWTDCGPTQTLIKAARVYDLVKRAEEFGIHAENARARWNAVQLRIAAVQDEIKALQREELSQTQIKIVRGAAQFVDASTLRVTKDGNEEFIHAQKFILACGSKPRIPDVENLNEIGFLTHQRIFEMRNLPRSWIVLGGAPFALEIAQALARFDCKVSLVQRASTLLPGEETEVSAACENFLRNEGVQIFCGASPQRAWLEGEKKYLEYKIEGEIRVVSANEVLVAVGKTANLTALNAAAIGVQWSERGVETNEYLQAAPNVWACGAATGNFGSARAQGKIAAHNALRPAPKKWDARDVPLTIFTDPEIARIGLTEEEARREYSGVKIYRREFAKLERAIIEGETTGLLKVVTAYSGQVLGAHIIGPSAGELIYPWVHAMRAETPLSEFAETIHVFPTLSEISQRVGNEYF